MPFFRHTHAYGDDPASERGIAGIAAEIVAAEAQAAEEYEAGRDQRRRDDVTDEQIVSLRARGMSWSAIAAQTGMSRSGARQRWLSASGEPRARDR